MTDQFKQAIFSIRELLQQVTTNKQSSNLPLKQSKDDLPRFSLSVNAPFFPFCFHFVSTSSSSVPRCTCISVPKQNVMQTQTPNRSMFRPHSASELPVATPEFQIDFLPRSKENRESRNNNPTIQCPVHLARSASFEDEHTWLDGRGHRSSSHW